MKILVAPLDWGLGHATRCIPVILELIEQGNEVLIAADGNVAHLLKKEFPALKFISLKGYNMNYSLHLPMSLSMLLQAPKMLLRIFLEHRKLKIIIRENQPDAVISDNRYGLWNKRIHSVFITHQVMIKCPPGLRFLEPLLYFMNKLFISRFDECWIPDDQNKISGDLSHARPLPPNAKFIGILSRWTSINNSLPRDKYDVIGIISGPEPYRTSFEKLLINQFTLTGLRSLIIQGKPAQHTEQKINDRLTVVSHLDSQELFEMISSATTVICRSGYSTVMDLVAIKKNAILIPTPGQTEQRYLADHLRKRKIFFSMEESKFNLEKAITESKKYSVSNLVDGETSR